MWSVSFDPNENSLLQESPQYAQNSSYCEHDFQSSNVECENYPDEQRQFDWSRSTQVINGLKQTKTFARQSETPKINRIQDYIENGKNCIKLSRCFFVPL